MDIYDYLDNQQVLFSLTDRYNETYQIQFSVSYLSWTIERRLFEREKEQFNRQIRKDKEKYQKDTENLNATLTRKQAEMDEMNAL